MSDDETTPAATDGRMPEPLWTQVRRRVLSALGATPTADPDSLALSAQWEEGHEVEGGRELDTTTLCGHWSDSAPQHAKQRPEADGSFAGFGGVENEDVAKLVIDLATPQAGSPKTPGPGGVLLRALLDRVGAPEMVDLDLAMVSFEWSDGNRNEPARFAINLQWHSATPQFVGEFPLFPGSAEPYRHDLTLEGDDAVAALTTVVYPKN